MLQLVVISSYHILDGAGQGISSLPAKRFCRTTEDSASSPRLPDAHLCGQVDQLLVDLLADQLAHGPRVHYSEPYCVACTMELTDAIFQGAPEVAGPGLVNDC